MFVRLILATALGTLSRGWSRWTLRGIQHGGVSEQSAMCTFTCAFTIGTLSHPRECVKKVSVKQT